MSYLGSRNAKGEKHGFGIMTYSDGCIYRGQYFMDRANGIGEFDWGDGNRYIGEFKNGKQDGYGIYCWPTGGCYEGMWKNDKMNGFGTYRRNDGVMYVGEWKDDHQFNDGIRIHPEKFLHGKMKKMERKREIRERWNEKRECIYSKEIQLYHDFWSVLVMKEKFCDVEIFCTVDPYAHLMEKQSLVSSNKNPHLETKVAYFVQSIDGSKTCIPSPVLLPPALDADLQIESSMKDFENRLQYLVKALPPSVSTSNIQQSHFDAPTESNDQQQIVFNPSNYYGSLFAQNLTNRLNLMVDALEKHGNVNAVRRQLSIQPPQQQQQQQVQHHHQQGQTIMTPDERSINRVNNIPASSSSHLLPNTFTTVATTPSSDQERTNFSAAAATTNHLPYSIPPLPFSPMFTSPSLFTGTSNASTSSSVSNSQPIENEEEEESRRLRKRKRTK